jgi:hypothetical protein
VLNMKGNVYKKGLIKGIGVSALLLILCGAVVASSHLCWLNRAQGCGGRYITRQVLAGTVSCYATGGSFTTSYLTEGPGFSETEYYVATCSWSCKARDGAYRLHLLEESEQIGTYKVIGNSECN